MENPCSRVNPLLNLEMKCGVPQEILRVIVEPLVARGILDMTRTSSLKKGQGRAVMSIGGRNRGMILKFDRCHDRIWREVKRLRMLNDSHVKEHFPRLESYGSVPDGGWSYLLQERVDGTPLNRIAGYFDCGPLIEQMIEVQLAIVGQPCRRGIESDWLESFIKFAEARLISLLTHGTISDITYRQANKVNEELLAASGSFTLLPIHGDLKPEHVYVVRQSERLKFRFVDLADATFGDGAWDVAVLTLENDQWMRVAVESMNNNIEVSKQDFSRRVELYQFIRTICNLDYAREFNLQKQGLLRYVEERLSRLRY